MNFFDHDYDYSHRELGLLSLRDRRTQADLVFVRNMISGRIDCPDLLECIGLHVPGRTSRIRHNLLPRSNLGHHIIRAALYQVRHFLKVDIKSETYWCTSKGLKGPQGTIVESESPWQDNAEKKWRGKASRQLPTRSEVCPSFPERFPTSVEEKTRGLPGN
ncbi:hypothetical protein DMN91_009501 [Ooceraea biroi]|uniref:Uncharacterized protein n=1 Tax=Ooceraea biroi TaxID=2015173 RepID=A0A3L8DG42_OOCBI|nr:hypothetical protein DMN91_009501 [Ooceraea biroi]